MPGSSKDIQDMLSKSDNSFGSDDNRQDTENKQPSSSKVNKGLKAAIDGLSDFVDGGSLTYGEFMVTTERFTGPSHYLFAGVGVMGALNAARPYLPGLVRNAAGIQSDTTSQQLDLLEKKAKNLVDGSYDFLEKQVLYTLVLSSLGMDLISRLDLSKSPELAAADYTYYTAVSLGAIGSLATLLYDRHYEDQEAPSYSDVRFYVELLKEVLQGPSNVAAITAVLMVNLGLINPHVRLGVLAGFALLNGVKYGLKKPCPKAAEWVESFINTVSRGQNPTFLFAAIVSGYVVATGSMNVAADVFYPVMAPSVVQYIYRASTSDTLISRGFEWAKSCVSGAYHDITSKSENTTLSIQGDQEGIAETIIEINNEETPLLSGQKKEIGVETDEGIDESVVYIPLPQEPPAKSSTGFFGYVKSFFSSPEKPSQQQDNTDSEEKELTNPIDDSTQTEEQEYTPPSKGPNK